MRRIALLCACACVLGLAGSTRAQTNVAFLAAGDYGVGGSAESTLGRRMHAYSSRYPVNMLVLLGDNDYTESPRRFRSNWTSSFGWARRSGLRVAGVLGNHDYQVARGRYELGLLGMSGPYYTRKLGDAQLFFLDSNSVGARQTAWLEQQLAQSTASWKIALFHHPPYTCGGHEGNTDVVRRWVPLFENYGVQLVLSGHDHNYQRFAKTNGITYVVHGGGAAGLYPLRRCPSSYPRRLRARYEHGFLSVSIASDRLDVSVVNTLGRVTDRFSLQP
ncbi:MAG: metallophosphoesterase [Actinomycetota bacterium]